MKFSEKLSISRLVWHCQTEFERPFNGIVCRRSREATEKAHTFWNLGFEKKGDRELKWKYRTQCPAVGRDRRPIEKSSRSPGKFGGQLIPLTSSFSTQQANPRVTWVQFQPPFSISSTMSDCIRGASLVCVPPSEARKTPVVTDPKPSVKDDGRSASLAPQQTHSTLLFFFGQSQKKFLFIFNVWYARTAGDRYRSYFSGIFHTSAVCLSVDRFRVTCSD